MTNARKLTALDCGSMYVDESSLVAGIHNGTYRNQTPRAEWVRIPVCAYLVTTAQGMILYDTGCHEREATVPEGADTPSPYVFAPGQLLPERLAQLGIAPEEIRFVVISHLHCDHAGYLHLFKNAQIIVSDAEFTGAMRQYGLRGFGAGPYQTEDFDAFLHAGLNWRLLRDDETEYELAPGVTAVNFGSGHAFGMVGLHIALPKSGGFLLCADALYRADNLGPPVHVPGLVYDSIGYTRSAEFIAQYAKRRGDRIIFGHDAKQFEDMLAEGGEWE
ncbi:MAG: N-acyl homoserine lactonase family protein [Oscillospiraceae bacterium]|jgi:glyoxylase-like metal-dependent hydrolase (beta-lactamase superfamily II)|nr:N-acyl homoserine lactonase family protein [Oscillospiraceae bacterium]